MKNFYVSSGKSIIIQYEEVEKSRKSYDNQWICKIQSKDLSFMEYQIIKEGKFEYVEVGEGETLMLCHGLFGALSNFSDLIEKFRHNYNVVVPILPLFDLDILHTSVSGLQKHIAGKYENMIKKLKTEKAQNAKLDELKGHLTHIQKNAKHYDNMLKMHSHLQKAKGVLIDTMNQHQQFEHHHRGEKTNPEGYVFHHGNDSDKFVNRAEFSKRNFEGLRNF